MFIRHVTWKNNKNPPIYSLDAFKEEFEEAEKKFDPSNIWPANKLTSCRYLAPQGSPFVYFDGVIPFRKISCYNKNTKKLRNLTEFSNVALTISLLALNKINNNIDHTYKNPLSLENVFDLRRISHNKETINWSIGSCITLPTVKAYVNSKSDTIEILLESFKHFITTIKPSSSFGDALNEIIEFQKALKLNYWKQN